MRSRRLIPLVLGLGLLASCTGGGKDTGPTPSSLPPGRTSIHSLVQGAQRLSVLTGLGAGNLPDEAIQTGPSTYVFDLSTSGNRLIEGGHPGVYVARSQTSPAIGPFPATWSGYTGYQKTGDRSPRTPFPGIYAADIRVPSAGIWTFAVVANSGSGRGVGIAHGFVSDHVVDAVGSRAVSVKTPVATTLRALREIDTRRPPDPLHYVSLSEALRNGKPTVAVFSTPLLCESKLCGPVTDEVLLAFRQVGKSKANFIHVEEFLPGPDLQPPPATAANQSPGFKAWHLGTEPWVFVIDRKGIIRARFGPGAIAAPEIIKALRPLL